MDLQALLFSMWGVADETLRFGVPWGGVETLVACGSMLGLKRVVMWLVGVKELGRTAEAGRT